MTTIPTCYHPSYGANTVQTSMRKPPVVAEYLLSQSLATLIDPTGIDPVPLLKKTHDPAYVDAVLTGGPGGDDAFGTWSPAIRDGVLAMQAGQLKAAELALAGAPVVGNIAQGFHHAMPDHGAGFCTFNGLALVAVAHPDLRIGVMDVDEHEGDGTSAFCERLPNLWNATVHGSPMRGIRHRQVRSMACPGMGRTPKAYLREVDAALAWLACQQPDLVLYNAGMDGHRDDPLGSLELDDATIRERDARTFRFWAKAGVPVVFCLAGGYQRDLQRLARIHAITWIAASN